MDFLKQLETYKTRIEEELNRWLPSKETYPTRLHEAMRYSVFAGGKRLRPVFIVSIAECLNSKIDPYPAAAAVECLHTYSLIHDDLPCCDNSDLRRHMPTCHRRFDEITALLAGDALLTKAFQILSHGYQKYPSVALECTRILSIASGSTGLVGGQAEDCVMGIFRERQRLNYINLKKTSALIQACFEIAGAIAQKGQLNLLKTAGVCIGFAFQVQDDILDLQKTPEILGKPTGQDISNKKHTYPLVYGIKESRQLVQKLFAKARTCVKKIGRNNGFVETLLANLESRSF